MLLAADVIGLLSAMLLAEFVSLRWGQASDLRTEILIFALSLPLWIVVAKLYGLYERDEERMDHSGRRRVRHRAST